MAERLSKIQKRARAHLARLERLWHWTATHDKALVEYIRANPALTDDYWQRAGEACGGRTGNSVYRRYLLLKRKGAPMPRLTLQGDRYCRFWKQAKCRDVAELLALNVPREEIAARHGVSLNALNLAIYHKGILELAAQMRGAVEADISTARAAWDDFFKGQESPGDKEGLSWQSA